MGIKKKRKLMYKCAAVLVALACIPTLYWAITSVMSGNYGDSIDNFYSQPIHPVIVLIVFAFLAVYIPIAYYKFKKGE